MTATQVRALVVETVRVEHPLDPFALIDATRPILWLRNGGGLAGIGEALRLEFSGPRRMTDAAAAWRDIVERATVLDPVGLPGSGLVAFGAFTFAASSAANSVLIVPEVIVGSRDGDTWLTRVRLDNEDAANAAGRFVGNAALPLGRSSLGRSSLGRSSLGRSSAAQDAAQDAGPAVRFAEGAMTKEAYRWAVRSALDSIRSSTVSKVVLARDLVGTVSPGGDLRRVLGNLATTYPDCWTFAVDGLVGASPETLVRVSGGRVNARVLAGTAPRGATEVADRENMNALLASTKDVAEHGFALRSALETLGPHSPDLESSADPFPLRLPNLWHLASDIEGHLGDGSGSLDLLGGLHPTAAVAGTPTPAATALIGELEPFDRGRYAGPVGWVGADGEGEWAVALRCAQVDADGTVTAYAGAGIVVQSDPDRELAETDLKFRPILDAFG